MYTNYVHLYDKKGTGVHGGASTSGSWETRDITDEVSDTANICTLSSNQFTLQAGTYRIAASAPAYAARTHLIRLYNITDTAVELFGISSFNLNGEKHQTRSYIIGKFTINDSKVFEIQHRVEQSRTTEGYGDAIDWGDNIYTIVELWGDEEGAGTGTIFGPAIQIV